MSKFLFHFAVHLVLEKDGQVLLSRRFQTGFQDDFYALPAGHVDQKEGALAAMVREAKEEIGIDILPNDLELAHTMYRQSNKEREYVDLYFRCQKWSGEIQNMEIEKCDDLRWFTPTDLPENTTPHIKSVLDSILKKVIYSELF